MQGSMSSLEQRIAHIMKLDSERTQPVSMQVDGDSRISCKTVRKTSSPLSPVSEFSTIDMVYFRPSDIDMQFFTSGSEMVRIIRELQAQNKRLQDENHTLWYEVREARGVPHEAEVGQEFIDNQGVAWKCFSEDEISRSEQAIRESELTGGGQ